MPVLFLGHDSYPCVSTQASGSVSPLPPQCLAWTGPCASCFQQHEKSEVSHELRGCSYTCYPKVQPEELSLKKSNLINMGLKPMDKCSPCFPWVGQFRATWQNDPQKMPWDGASFVGTVENFTPFPSSPRSCTWVYMSCQHTNYLLKRLYLRLCFQGNLG